MSLLVSSSLCSMITQCWRCCHSIEFGVNRTSKTTCFLLAVRACNDSICEQIPSSIVNCYFTHSQTPPNSVFCHPRLQRINTEIYSAQRKFLLWRLIWILGSMGGWCMRVGAFYSTNKPAQLLSTTWYDAWMMIEEGATTTIKYKTIWCSRKDSAPESATTPLSTSGIFATIGVCNTYAAYEQNVTRPTMRGSWFLSSAR